MTATLTQPPAPATAGPRRSVIVVGAGLGGLSAAVRLRARGYDVTVLERHAVPGGRCGLWEADGFRFDTGASWYLMPEVFDHFFRLMGTSAAERLDLVELDPGYRVLFEPTPDALAALLVAHHG